MSVTGMFSPLRATGNGGREVKARKLEVSPITLARIIPSPIPKGYPRTKRMISLNIVRVKMLDGRIPRPTSIAVSRCCH